MLRAAVDAVDARARACGFAELSSARKRPKCHRVITQYRTYTRSRSGSQRKEQSQLSEKALTATTLAYAKQKTSCAPETGSELCGVVRWLVCATGCREVTLLEVNLLA